MIDSAAIPVKDLILIGETLSLARKTVALQWFIGNISMIIVALAVFGFFLLSNLPIVNNEIKDRVVNNKTVFILSGCYLIGLIISQVYLRIFGTILWSTCYALGCAVWLKWDRWFIRRSSKIPMGWMISSICIILITLLFFNFLPSMITASKDAQNVFNSTN